MKKNLLTMASIAMMALLTFMSCEDDKAQYHAPVYKAITFSPNPCYPGDEVTATITYSNKGENWYYFKQTFVLDGETILQRTKSSTSTTLPDPPTCTFTAPAAGTHTFTFTGTPSSIAAGNPYPGDVSITGKLVVSASDNGDQEEEEEEE